jgi:hypothetical protein
MQAAIRLLAERKEKNFSLTSPLIALIEPFKSISVLGKWPKNRLLGKVKPNCLKCMVRRETARGSLGEKTSLRKCIRPLSGD